MQFRCPNCRQPIRVEDHGVHDDETLDAIECPSCHSRFSFSSHQPSTVIVPIGAKIGHFEVQTLLGEGSFGTVFKAWDTELLRHVALKVPREGRISNETSRLFLREARTAAGISHPNVVSVYEMGQHSESFYIATEFIDGITLSEYLRNHTFEPQEAVKLVIKLLRGVQVFHSKGIIHRDLKPGNVLLDLQNEPHISDFGLARSDDHTDLSVTNSGRILGTLLYMPPEQARGEVRSLSNRSDIYAIGVILYELLTGHRPFNATSSRTLLYSILTDSPVSPRVLRKNVARDLETICLKAMEKDPYRRFSSATEMADDLQRFLDQRPILSRPVSTVERAWRLICRHRLVSALTAVLIPLMAIVTVFVFQPERVTIIPGKDHTKIIEAPPVRHPVQLSFSLAGNTVPPNSLGNWTILPLDKRTREPVTADAIRISQAATAETHLPPGEYLVVVDVPNFGFHEVYRYVPEDPTVKVRSIYAHHRWEADTKGHIVLPPISIRATPDIVNGMIPVPAGTFVMGDGKADRPEHSRDVAAFFVDPREVTVDEFQQLMLLGTDYSFPLAAHPVAVHWNKAVAYAELVGKRLLKEDEFEYLARDVGQSRYPNGNQPIVQPGELWSYPVAGQPEADRLTSLPIYGMHSNVAEWTDSLLNPYPGMPDPGPELEIAMNKHRSRVVRGGPVSAGANDRSLNRWDESSSFRFAWDESLIDSEIGFRCARSAVARFRE